MNKRRVLLVTKLYHPWIGGIERHVQDIAEALKDRFDIKVLCCQSPGEPGGSQVNGVSLHRTPSLGIYFSMPVAPSFPFHLQKLAAESDILHYHLPFPLGVLSHWLARPKIKTVVTWHSDVVRQKTMDAMLSPWTHWFLGNAETVVATSQSLIRSSPYLKAYENKCQVIPLSVDPSSFELTAERKAAVDAVRRKYPGSTLALFVGRLVPYKGPGYLLEALAQCRANIKLLLVGSGPLEREMKKLSFTLGIQNRVEFLGSVGGEELIRLYHACDFFTLPSVTNNEAFGIVQMEAMACGKPVVNTYLPTGVPEVSLHEETGLTVHPRDSHALALAMDRLSQDVSLREKLGQNAKERVLKEFSIKSVADKIAALYQ